MKLIAFFATGWILTFANVIPLHAHTSGANTVHEVSERAAPKVTLEIQKDPTGGFNVHVVTSNFLWRPEMASMKHVEGEGHAHVYLDGRKIMRIYSEWFHLNTYQFATTPGEQLLTIEFVGNDHAPYTRQGLPIGAELLVNVPSDELQPALSENKASPASLIILLAVIAAGLFLRLRRGK